jgi:TonB family protein
MEPLQNIKLTFKCPKQLNELQPCNGDWYCDGCRRIVHDFRGMTEAQVLDAFAKSNYRMCGIFEADRIQVLPQQSKWLGWASAAMLFLGLTACHDAVMGKIKKPVDTSSVKKMTSRPVLGKTYTGGSVAQAIKNLPAGIVDSGVVFGGMGYEPEFPGGQAALAKYLYDHVKYSGNHQGKAFVQFIVEKDGSLTNIKMIRSAGKDIDEQIINALGNSKKWKPGIENGKPVSVQYTVPFQLECKE